MNDILEELKKGQPSGSPPDKGQEGDPPTPKPYDDDPKWKAARAAEKSLNELLESSGFEDIESLADHLKSTKDIDISDLVEKAQTLSKYEEYWAANEEDRRRQEETPDETIQRLEKKVEDLTGEWKSDKQSQSDIKAAEDALSSYNETVTSMISSEDSIPESQREFLGMFLGVNNPAIEVDIENPKAVKKMAEQGIKKYRSFVESILKDYRDGKLKIPTVPKTPGGEPPAEGEKKIKNIRDARKISVELLKNKLFRGRE